MVSSCGTCTSPATCGGGGTPNVCGTATCAPESNTTFCSRLGKNCGSVTGTDNCGVSRMVSSCGTCTSPATCGGGGTPNVCGTSGSTACSFTVTQNVYDGNGWWGTISFKNNGPSASSAFAVSFGIPSGAHCDFAETGWTFSQSGTTCTYKKPGTTLAAGASLTFHYSTDSQAFSAASGVTVTDSTCGGSSCTPESNTTFCSRLGKNCGSVTGTDNCGVSRTVSSCGTCTSPATCGGGGTSNVCGTAGGGSGGNFPSRFAAPYVATWNNNNLVNLSNGTGNKFWTLAFIINGSGSCNPTWNGDTSLTGNSYGTYITNLRSIGGDVIVSFGGASGTEIAKSCPDVATTQAAYQKVISQFKLTWIDLDIESGQESDTASVDRRNKAMKNLQAANPGLRISYTLAVDRSGLPSGPRNLLANAKSNGVAVTTVNIMAMDYGPCYTDMGQAAIDAANATRNQLSTLGLNAKVGVTPMIGTNDVTCEKFTTTDASILVNYAKANSFINLLAYWVQDADGSHSYINIFKTFP
jgi:chitinase